MQKKIINKTSTPAGTTSTQLKSKCKKHKYKCVLGRQTKDLIPQLQERIKYPISKLQSQ